MTDDQILAAAERIKARRLNKARLDSFQTKATVTIRWDNIGAKFGESYSGIMVDRELVEAVVQAHFTTLLTPETDRSKE